MVFYQSYTADVIIGNVNKTRKFGDKEASVNSLRDYVLPWNIFYPMPDVPCPKPGHQANTCLPILSFSVY